MSNASPVKIGVAFAATVAIGYLACSLVFWAWPGSALAFMNSLFHGLDFGRLQSPGGFNVGGTVSSLVVLSTWTGVLAGLFSWFVRGIDR